MRVAPIVQRTRPWYTTNRRAWLEIHGVGDGNSRRIAERPTRETLPGRAVKSTLCISLHQRFQSLIGRSLRFFLGKLASISSDDHRWIALSLEPFMITSSEKSLWFQVFPRAYLWEMPAFTTSFLRYHPPETEESATNTSAHLPVEPRGKSHMEKMGDLPRVLT